MPAKFKTLKQRERAERYKQKQKDLFPHKHRRKTKKREFALRCKRSLRPAKYMNYELFFIDEEQEGGLYDALLFKWKRENDICVLNSNEDAVYSGNDLDSDVQYVQTKCDEIIKEIPSLEGVFGLALPFLEERLDNYDAVHEIFQFLAPAVLPASLAESDSWRPVDCDLNEKIDFGQDIMLGGLEGDIAILQDEIRDIIEDDDWETVDDWPDEIHCEVNVRKYEIEDTVKEQRRCKKQFEALHELIDNLNHRICEFHQAYNMSGPFIHEWLALPEDRKFIIPQHPP